MDHQPTRTNTTGPSPGDEGRPFDRPGHGRHRGGKEIAPKQHEAKNFARELAHKLEKDRRGGAYQRLVIAAAPRFLGHLRTCLSTHVRDTVSEEVCKDLVNIDARKVRRSLPARL